MTVKIMTDLGFPYEYTNPAQLMDAITTVHTAQPERLVLVSVQNGDKVRVFGGYHAYIYATNLTAKVRRMRLIKVVSTKIV